nr:unnamed protein product [Spirometra erinaceieuropaei]
MLAVYELLTDPTFKAQQQSSDRLLDRDFAGCFAVYPPPRSSEVEEKVCDWAKITRVLRPTNMLCQGYKEKEEEKEKKKKKKEEEEEEEEEEEKEEEEEEEES